MNVIAPPAKLLIIGATGSIGRLVVAEALHEGYRVRALVRGLAKAQRLLPPQVELAVGDVTQPETLTAAVDGMDAIVFTHGADGGGKADSRNVDYGAVRNALFALGKRKLRIALMTAIGVTNRTADYNRRTEAHDWKRRAERLVRTSGLPCTIVRPAADPPGALDAVRDPDNQPLLDEPTTVREDVSRISAVNGHRQKSAVHQ